MRKKAVLAALALSMLTVPCAAKTVYEAPVFLDDGYVQLSGKAETGGGAVTLRAARTNPGQEPEYVAIMETVAESTGAFTFTFRIPQEIDGASSNGSYSVWLKAEGEDTETETFSYVNFTYMKERLAAAGSGEDLYAILNGAVQDDLDALAVMGMAVEEMQGVKGSLKEIADTWYGLCDFAQASAETMAETFNQAVGLAYAKAGAVETALRLINPVYGETAYNAEPETRKKEMAEAAEANLAAGSLEAFRNCYTLAGKVLEFRGMQSAAIVEKLESYDTWFGFKGSSWYASYNNMSTTQKGKVADSMREEMGSALKASQILTAFENAVKNNANPGGTGSLGGSGSYGGGKSSGGSGGYTPAGSGGYEVETLPQTAQAFTDLAGVSWAVEAIEALSAKGIVSGKAEGVFAPEDQVTREEFAKLVVMACGIHDPAAACDFTDVDKGQWYYSYIASAAERGLIQGQGDGSFGVGSLITRQDMAALIARAAQAAGKALNPVRTPAEFSDDAQIADYAKESVMSLYRAGMINGMGDNRFAPQEPSTRAQAAKIIYETFIK